MKIIKRLIRDLKMRTSSIFHQLKSLKVPLFKELDDQTFLSNLYREVLHREIDPAGLQGNLYRLSSGESRWGIVLSVLSSSEFRNRILSSEIPPPPRHNLMALKPERYVREGDFLLFEVRSIDDYDWLERMILENGYYEHIGAWGYEVDLDKRVLAELFSLFRASRSLEIGCGTGAVLKCLLDLGLESEGIELSKYSVNHAFPEIKPKIWLGDLLALDLTAGAYDLIFGMDVFEHLNPNKIFDYIKRVNTLLSSGGFLVINVPAFGVDDVFGYVHTFWVSNWQEESQQHVMFSRFPVDDLGYPHVGHLIWADSVWWENTFHQTGFHREREIEKALHEVFDTIMSYSDARKSYFVFSKSDDVDAKTKKGIILQTIRQYDRTRLSRLKVNLG